MKMTLNEILVGRRSCRRFTAEVPSREVIETLLAEALTAPSSKNTRSTRYVVVTDPAKLQTMSQMRDYGSALLAGAPVAIVVCGDEQASDLWEVNCSISATILQLAVEEQGLGSCWVHIKDRPHLKDDPSAGSAEEWLSENLPIIPEGWRPLCVVAVGYPEVAAKPHAPKDDSDKVLWVE